MANKFAGFSGGGGNMSSMMKQAQKMQRDIAETQERLAAATYTSTVGGGAVSVTISGEYQITELNISPDAIDPDDPDMLADLVTAAVNDALRTVRETGEREMSAISGGLNLGF